MTFLFQIIQYCIDNFVPLKRIQNSNFPSWFSPELKNLTIRKKVAHKKYMSSGSEVDYLEFSRLRSLCKVNYRLCYNEFIRVSEESLTSDPRRFWRYVNERRKINNLPGSMYFEDQRGESGEDIANLFSIFFSGVYDG